MKRIQKRRRTPKITWSLSRQQGESPCMVELIRGLVMSLLVIPGHIMQSSEDPGCGLNSQLFRQPFSQTSPVFSHVPQISSSSGHLTAGEPFQQRAGRGKERSHMFITAYVQSVLNKFRQIFWITKNNKGLSVQIFFLLSICLYKVLQFLGAPLSRNSQSGLGRQKKDT